MKNQLQTLLSKDMSRKEFLQHVGAGVLVLFGVSGLLRALTQGSSSTRGADLEYGGSVYGGLER